MRGEGEYIQRIRSSRRVRGARIAVHGSRCTDRGARGVRWQGDHFGLVDDGWVFLGLRLGSRMPAAAAVLRSVLRVGLARAEIQWEA